MLFNRRFCSIRYMYAAVGAAVLISTSILLRNWDVPETIATRSLFTGWETSASEPTMTERWLAEQQMRTRHMRHVCARYKDLMSHTDVEKLSESGRKYLKGNVVSDRYKAVFHPIAKVSSSSWNSLLLTMSGDFENKTLPGNVHDFGLLNRHGWSLLANKNISDIVHILKTYTKFLVVRHPYSRLHSAFTNKFQQFSHGKPNPIYPRLYGSRVVKQYWENPTPESLKTGLNISFQDFIRFVGDPQFSTSYKFDWHWMPFYLQTHPCVVKFDYILKLETIAEDSEQFLKNILNTTYRLPQKNVQKKTNLAAYGNIPAPIMERLWETYHLDFKLFGYEWSN